MRIFLDENMPQKLVSALRSLGHEVESIHTVNMDGVANGELYRFIAHDYDVCFTRDEDFARRCRGSAFHGRVKVIRATLKQRPQDAYIIEFLTHFIQTDWEQLANGDDWPLPRQ